MKYRFHLSPDEGPGGSGEGDGSEEGTSEEQAQEGTAGSESQGDVVARTELTKVSREAAKYRRERNDLKEQLQQLQDRDKTDLDREREKSKRLEDELKANIRTTQALRVQVIATRVGVIPEARADAARLLDWDQIQDPTDERELEAALRDMVKEKPFLLGSVPGGSDGGAGGTRGNESQDMNALLRAAAGRT